MNASITLPALMVRQPIGDFFIVVMAADFLCKISFADIRDLDNELDGYLGIQRKLDKKRVRAIKSYVKNVDATFPTSVLLAIDEQHVEWNEATKTIRIFADDDEALERIGKILDGQHRVAGLEGYCGTQFDVCVAIFINADMPDQANIFSTVNISQTKVVKSLVYDLYDYQNARSPQKSSHNVAIALDTLPGSPFEKRIKRLGYATGPGQFLTQATVVEELMSLITVDANSDRDDLMRGRKLAEPTDFDLRKVPFRKLFISDDDSSIAGNMVHYFSAVRDRWPTAWRGAESGQILPKTNGFKSLMFGLREIYIRETSNYMDIIPASIYRSVLDRIDLADSDFNVQNFTAGSSGQAELKRRIRAVLGN